MFYVYIRIHFINNIYLRILNAINVNNLYHSGLNVGMRFLVSIQQLIIRLAYVVGK